MTSKLKCPFCGEKLYSSDNCYVCLNDDCIFCGFHFMEKRWKPIIELKQALIQSQKDLEESQQATLQNAQTVLEIHKDLEVATKALEKLICEYNRCRDEEFEGEDIDWEWWAMAAKNVVEAALKQLEHKE